MRAEPHERTNDARGTGRVEAFSDGIFAVAITLLVLTINVPHADALRPGESLLHALGQQWPSYLAYVTSFATILIMWVNHHNLFQQIWRTDHPFLLLNGVLLLGITVVPFPTALLATYIREPQARTAALVYSGMFLVIAIFFNLMWRYAAQDGRLLGPTADRRFVAVITRQYRTGPLLYLIPFALAFLSAFASFGFCMALAVYFALPISVTHRLHGVRSRADAHGDA